MLSKSYPFGVKSPCGQNESKMGFAFCRAEEVTMADQLSEISAVLEKMKALPDAQLYLDLSDQYISESRTYVYEAAEKSLSKEDREKMDNWQGAGLYGPISAVFGRLEDKYQLDIMRARNMQPNVEQGKNLFSANWAVGAKQNLQGVELLQEEKGICG